MRKPKPVWLLVTSDGRVLDLLFSTRSAAAVVAAVNREFPRPVKFVPAPTTKKRKAKRK